MKIFGLILLLFITSHSYGQLKTGLRFVMEGGSSIATLKQKEGSIYTSLSVSGLPTVKYPYSYDPGKIENIVIKNFFLQFRTGLIF